MASSLRSELRSEISVEWLNEFTAYSGDECHDLRAVCSLKAPLFEPNKDCRVQLDIVAVIDVSGSMSSTLSLVKNSLNFIIDNLHSKDRFSLITYSTDVVICFGLTHMTDSNKTEKKKVVNSLVVKSQTNLCEGLLTGMYEIIDRIADNKADIASVLLFTDGKANVGIDKKHDILEEMRKAISPPKEYAPFEGTINIFGYGSDNDANLLESISSETGGVYYYIHSNSNIESTMCQCFLGLASTLSKDVKLNFMASTDDIIISAIHTPRAPKLNAEKKIWEATLNDLQSKEERDILVELKLPKSSESINSVIVCELQYFNVITRLPVRTVRCLTVTRNSSTSQCSGNVKVDMQINRLIVTCALKRAKELAELENFSEAKTVLLEAKGNIVSSVSHSQSLCQNLVKDLQKAVDNMKTSDLYRSHGAHYLICKEQTHNMQRTNFALEENMKVSSKAAVADTEWKAV